VLGTESRLWDLSPSAEPACRHVQRLRGAGQDGAIAYGRGLGLSPQAGCPGVSGVGIQRGDRGAASPVRVSPGRTSGPHPPHNCKWAWKTLSRLEREIMVLPTQGATSGEIARKIGISTGTADWHVNNILNKMHLHSRDQAQRKFLGAEFLLSRGRVKTYSFPSCTCGSFMVQFHYHHAVRECDIDSSWLASRASRRRTTPRVGAGWPRRLQ
jgi:DNA-binding CsgD family transcriptional regulator